LGLLPNRGAGGLIKWVRCPNHLICSSFKQQAGAAPGFSAKTWCLVCFLESLMSIFNCEQDGLVLLILLRNDLFKLRRHQCFILENSLKIKTFKNFHFKRIFQIKTLKYWYLRGPQHNSNFFSKYFFYLAEN